MKSNYALLVIDMQLCGFDGKITPPIEDGDQLVEKVAKLIALCRLNKIPIIYIQHCGSSGLPYAKEMHGWEIHPAVFPQKGDSIVFKRNSSGFEETDLRQHLIKLGVNSVITCGIQSEFCVTNTSMSALGFGYKVFVAADVHGTVSSDEWKADEIVGRQNSFLEQHQASVIALNELREVLNLS
ncbi:MAG: isochorismatase [Hyphococcus sp.]|nr:MAG: isochorismatase [Marinicaulis sp.]